MPTGTVVTGLGMVTAVGRTVEASAGAFRAGIVRSAPLPGYVTADDDVVSGHLMRGFTEGFRGMGLWVRLGAGCLNDLARFEGATAERTWERTGLITVVPLLDEDRLLLPVEGAAGLIETQYVDAVLRITGIEIPVHSRVVLEAGHTGAAEAVSLARRWLDAGQVDRVLVLAADSYLDPESLDFLDAREALKKPDQPHGTMPGEAGACFAIEREDVARRAGRHPTLALASEAYAAPAESPAPPPVDPGEHIPHPADIGDRWADAVIAALAIKGGVPFRGDLWLDVNGEAFQSAAWGHAMTRLHRHVDFNGCRAYYPASCLGETGAASSVAAVCLSARAFARRYATSAEALICSVGDRGRVSAMLVTDPAQG